MITNEVAFVAIAVSDKERARKFYQETLELKPTRTQMDGAWVEYRPWTDHDRSRLSPGVATFARRNDGRFRGRRYRCRLHEAQRARRELRHGKDRDAGLLDGAISRPRREQAGNSQEKKEMNQETRKPGDKSAKQERRNHSDGFHGFVGSRFFPLFLLS